MSANQAELPVQAMCQVLKVSTSGLYDWQGRKPSVRARANAALSERIARAYAESDSTYGMPRIRAELRDAGVVASKKRIARLMRTVGSARGQPPTRLYRHHRAQPTRAARARFRSIAASPPRRPINFG